MVVQAIHLRGSICDGMLAAGTSGEVAVLSSDTICARPSAFFALVVVLLWVHVASKLLLAVYALEASCVIGLAAHSHKLLFNWLKAPCTLWQSVLLARLTVEFTLVWEKHCHLLVARVALETL